MGNIDKFLNAYKDMEIVMRLKKNMEVREWEEKNEGKTEAERLKVCRIIRNYVSHNDTSGFICKVDGQMIRWIKNFTKELKKGSKKQNKVKVEKRKNIVKVKKTKKRIVERKKKNEKCK